MADVLQCKKIKWDIADIILIIFLTLSLTTVIFIGIEWLEDYFVLEFAKTVQNLTLNSIQAVVLATLTISLINLRYDITLKDFGLKIVNFSRILKYGLVGGIIICTFITLLNNIIHIIAARLWGITPVTQQVIQNLLQTKSNLLFFIYSIVIIIIAPITEEIFFRGFVYPYCKSKFGKGIGLILNGAVFGLAHFSFWLFLPTCLGGIILAWIYERTNSLYSSMLAHGIWNMIIVSLIYIIWKIGII